MREDGTLGTAKFQDGKAGSPFYIAFLNSRPDAFVLGYAVGDGCAMGTIEADGKLNIGPLVKIDTSAGLPSELCWLAVSPDDIFGTASPAGRKCPIWPKGRVVSPRSSLVSDHCSFGLLFHAE